MIKTSSPRTIRLLGRLVLYRPWLYLLNTIVWIGVHNVGIVAELAGRGFYDLLEGKPAGWPIHTVIIVSLAIYVLRVIFMMTGSLVDAEHRFVVRSLLQRNLLKLIYRHPAAELLPVQGSEAITIVRSENDTLADTISWTVDLFAEVIALVIALGLLMSIDLQMTLILYASLLIVVGVSTRLENVVQEARERAQEAGARIGEQIGEIFGSIQAVQIACAQPSVLQHLNRLYVTRRNFVFRERMYNLLFDGMFYLNFTLLTAIILWLASTRLLVGAMSVGDLSLFINYLDMLTESALFVGVIIVNYAKSTVAFKRYGEVSGTEDYSLLVRNDAADRDEKQADDRSGALASFVGTNLSRAYPQTAKGIAQADIEITAGSFTVITGIVGSGKTTVLRCLLGLLTLDEGELSWNGQVVKDPKSFFIPPRCAYVPQQPILISGSIRDNLALDLECTDQELLEALATVDFLADLDTMPQGLDTPIGSKGMKLSGGQMQRVATARALLRKADLMVFDDLSSALDLRTEQTIWQNLNKREATFLVVSHRQAAFRRADKIIVLSDGRVEATGTWQELLATSLTFRGLWDLEQTEQVS
ncbi:MAG: ABC transporter ATP-binding protein/permease [Symbiobacteriaceae bacterium]|nr:ABC transporter ATP-binding protein/permease [Symbiobacteriaceae bacterium]